MGIERDPLHHGRVLHLPEARSLLGLQLCICRMTPPPPPATVPILLLPLERI